MQLAAVPLREEHVPQLAQICFDAFGSLQDRHGVERDFESLEIAQMVIGMLSHRDDFAGYVAVDQSGGKEKVLGSNFFMFCDGVIGVGPITVDPNVQAKGVGTLLMNCGFIEAHKRGITKLRLQQEAINTSSLSLYTKLGYDWRFGCALMRPAPAAKDDPRIRPVTMDDLPMVNALSTRGFHDTRVNEVAGYLRFGFPGFILEREDSPELAGMSIGRKVVAGYYFPGLFGHGFAAAPEDMADLIGHAMRHAPPMFHKALVPLDQHHLHRLLLERGGRTIKLFNYMSHGEYQHPIGAWIPSIGM